MTTIYVMACCVIPQGAPGIWKVEALTLEEFVHDLTHVTYQSTIGHPATAAILETLTGLEFEANRVEIEPKEGDQFYCLMLNSRPPEGQVLTEKEIYSIGFQFRKMTYSK